MENWVSFSIDYFNSYINFFDKLTEQQQINFDIKKEHSLRVAENSGILAQKLGLGEEGKKIAFLSGLFHDIGRFPQLVEFNTFNDAVSVDHAEYSVKVLRDEGVISKLDSENEELIYMAIQNHNKIMLPEKLTANEYKHARLLRDADKLDILKVVTEYYSNPRSKPNHTLTWELAKGTQVSPIVAREILSGKLVSKKDVVSELDVKIMQLSWVFDLNFKASFECLIKNRYLEKIYGTLPKNDLVIEIYRKVKVYSENRYNEAE